MCLQAKNVTCLDTGADKDEALAPYKDSGMYWIEDKTANAVLGADMGLNTLLVNHGHKLNPVMIFGLHGLLTGLQFVM